MLNITKKVENTSLTIGLSGKLDTVTSPQLETEIKESINGITLLTFDLAELEYVSSAGLRVLLSAQKIMNTQGKMVVKNVAEAVKDIFDVTGFSDILTIE